MASPFAVRSFRFRWPADLATSWAFKMEVLILGWYVLSTIASFLFVGRQGVFLGTSKQRWWKNRFTNQPRCAHLPGVVLASEPAPDGTTVCKFRHLLVRNGLGTKLFQEVGRYL